MPIQINGLPNTPSSTINEGNATKTDSSNHDSNHEQNEPNTPSKIDTVNITETATQLQLIENQIAKVPVVDLIRIKDMQQLLASGKYEINENKLAENLLRFELQF